MCKLQTVILIVSSCFAEESEFARTKLQRRWRPPPNWFEEMILANIEENRKDELVPQDEQNEPFTFQEQTVDYGDELSPETQNEYSGASKQVARRQSGYGHNLKFQSLCPSRERYVYLNEENNPYEYKEQGYDEITCQQEYGTGEIQFRSHQKINKVCGTNNFSCVQLRRRIFLLRRLKGSKSE